jgi:hypothetical protein
MSGWKSSTHHPLTVRLVKLAAQRMQGRPDALGDFTVAVDHGGGCFSIELHMLESLENPLMNLPVNRHDETFNRWIDEWFRDYLSAEPAPEPTVQAEPVAAVVDAPEPMPRQSQGTEKRWTPELLTEMAAFRHANGTKAAAEKYSISEARVRKLQPSDNPTPRGHSAFSHRPK